MPCNPDSKKSCNNCSCDSTASGPSVSLPSRTTPNEATPLLWSTSNLRPDSTATDITAVGDEQSSAGKKVDPEIPRRCEKLTGSRRGVCCRELKPDDDRTLVSPGTVRDIIIGLSDGLTVPFALTAGLSGVGSSKIVVLAGLAELVSGAISMGIGGFLSAQAEVQHYEYVSKQTRDRIARSCMGEMEREVSEILTPYGLSEDLAERVASQLQRVEQEECALAGQGLPSPVASTSSNRVISRAPDSSRGLTAFLLRHDGLETVATSRIWMSAITIGASYLVGGAIPLLPYIFIASVREALFVSIAITGFVLIVFGVIKQRLTGGACDSRGLLWGAVSTLAVGGLAAGASFAIVRALEGGGLM